MEVLIEADVKAHRIAAVAKSTVDLVAFDLPPVGPDQVLVETHYSAISPGTELAFLHHKPNTPGEFPYYPGYSASGRILTTGEAVDSLAVGQRVACQIPHASQYVVSASKCLPIPESVKDLDASVFRLVSIALQGVRKAQIQLGWDVAVVGLGPIGNIAGQLCRASGAAHVEGIDPIPWRRDLALRCGFDTATDSVRRQIREGGYDCVIEATGVPEAIPAAFQLAKTLGHVVLLGSTRGETLNVNFYRDVHKKGLTIFGAHNSIRPAMDDHQFFVSLGTDDRVGLKMLASGRVQTGPLISDIVSPEEAPEAYHRLTKRDEQLMLIAFEWQ